jgi:hypothetical protein
MDALYLFCTIIISLIMSVIGLRIPLFSLGSLGLSILVLIPNVNSVMDFRNFVVLCIFISAISLFYGVKRIRE